MELNEVFVRILMAAFLGGLIGIEREYRDKSAGFRTMIVISVGAALFTIISFLITEQYGGSDPTRIASYIISGIGFLGAGVIIKDGSSVKGLTTASTIWMSAALGMGAGAGLFMVSAFAGAAILFALIVLPTLEHWIDNIHEFRQYEIEVTKKADYDKALSLFKKSGLRIFKMRRKMIDGKHWMHIYADGPPIHHEQAVEMLIESGVVRSVHS